MKQIGNWVFGSFFRTIGRLLVFVLLGFIIASVVDFKSIIDNFRITDLFFEKVDALTITSEVTKKETTIYTQDDNYSSWTDEWGKYSMIINNASGINYQYIQFVQDSGILANHDYAEISFSMSQPLSATQSWQAQDDFVTCRSYNCESYNTYGVCQQWKCATWYTSGTSQAQTAVEHNTSTTILNFFYTMVLSDNTTTNCSVNNNTIVCPLNKKKPRALRLYVNFPTSYSTTTKFILDRNMSYYDSATNQIIEAQQGTTNAIDSQTQQQQQQHEELMDTNMTETNETATSFFDSFESDDIGGLSGIVTAPLNMINKMLDGTCTSPSATWKGATISLPCGDMFWNRPGAGDIKQLLNIFYGGFLCYYAIRKLFLMVENLKDPTQDRIEVSDL